MKALYLIFLFGICTACKQAKGPNSESFEAASRYKEAKKNFDSASVSHFPDRIQGVNPTFSTSQDTRYSHPGILLKVTCEAKYLDSVARVAKQRARAQYQASDTCLLIIDEHLTAENRLKFSKRSAVIDTVLLERPCATENLPVPKFFGEFVFETTETRVGLDRGYILYVLDADRGIFRDSTSLPNGRYTPKGWEHGYSKGIAINAATQTAIFWYDVW